MGKKKATYNKTGIESLPDDKPVLYRIETEAGKLNYAGVAQRGRVQDRLSEHLGNIPGATVQIEQFNSTEDAREKEARVIKKNQPKYNDQDK
ncbi:MAG: GIY-YIG nuclease family protein [candidate division Zixibacteria bacterium]|nr:GIY-YIG nuclease family protein [candidate division Zixibacteria bacterium]MBU2625272.1 GIY-YIG nuclease family protein [candidate division Zixibacteria bacterium]